MLDDIIEIMDAVVNNLSEFGKKMVDYFETFLIGCFVVMILIATPFWIIPYLIYKHTRENE